MTKRQYIISGIITLFILVGAALGFTRFAAQKKSTVSSETAKREVLKVFAQKFVTEDIKSKIDIDGRLNAYEKINIASEVSGRLNPTAKKWRDGSYFSQGEVLFEIGKEDQLLNLYAQRSSLLNAITQIMPDLKFDYPAAFGKWKTYLDRFEIERTTPPLPRVSSDQEKYYVAGKNIYNLYYAIKSAEDRINDYTIKAPFNGVFLSVSAFPGAVVSPGASLGRVMNTNTYELQSPINMKDFKLIKRGQKVNLYSESLGTSYTGTISRISNQIDQATQSIPLYISVRGQGLRDGMYLKGSLTAGMLTDVAALPISAIANQNEVYIVQDSIIRSRDVEIVLRTDEFLYVRGIGPNDNVIVKGLNSLSPGQRAVATKL